MEVQTEEKHGPSGDKEGLSARTRVDNAAAGVNAHDADGAILTAFSGAAKDGDGRTRCYVAKALGEMRVKGSIGLLIGLLADPDPDVRCDAAEALGNLRDGKAVAPLAAALKDEDGRVRLCAIRSLVEIDDPACVEPVIEAMFSKDDFHFDIGADLSGNYLWEIQEKAAWALGELGSSRAVKALDELLDMEDSDLITGTALKSLVKIGGFKNASFYLKDPDTAKRRVASRAFVHAKDPEAVACLREALMDDDGIVRANAVEAIGRIGGEYEILLLVLLLKDGAPAVRINTIEAITRLCGRKAERYAVQLLEDPDREVRKKAIKILGSIGGPNADGHILKVLTNGGEDEGVLCEAIAALAKTDDSDAASSLRAVMLNREKSRTIRSVAASTLHNFDNEESLGSLAAVLADGTEDGNIRLTALHGIAALGEKRSLGVFKAMIGDGDKFLKIAVAKAVRDFEIPEAADLLKPLLNDGDLAVRKEAAVSLALMGNGAGLDTLVTSAGEAEGEGLLDILKALGNLEDETSRRLMSEALGSDSPALRRAAAAAVRQGSRAHTDLLIAMLGDDMADVRREAVAALGRTADRNALRPLVTALYDLDNFFNMRREIAMSLGQIDKKTAAGFLLEKLTANDADNNRWVAIEAISTLRGGTRAG